MTNKEPFTSWLDRMRTKIEDIREDDIMKRLSTEIINFDDAGADDDHPVKGITMGHIRRWFDRAEEFELARAELAALIPDPENPTESAWPCGNPADRECLQKAYRLLT